MPGCANFSVPGRNSYPGRIPTWRNSNSNTPGTPGTRVPRPKPSKVPRHPARYPGKASKDTSSSTSTTAGLLILSPSSLMMEMVKAGSTEDDEATESDGDKVPESSTDTDAQAELQCLESFECIARPATLAVSPAPAACCEGLWAGDL
eukprot:3596127-Rhodomonas_salina.1